MLTIKTTLGIYQNTEETILGFKVRLDKKPNIKWSMLPVVSSIYNLLGLMPPSILKGRRALHKLCSKKFNWDEPNNENVKKLWQKW